MAFPISIFQCQPSNKIKIQCPIRHKPIDPKWTKQHRPQTSSDITMKQYMIYGFPTLLENVTPIHKNYIHLPYVVPHQMFPNAAVHVKNATLLGTMTLRIFFQRKDESLLACRTLQKKFSYKKIKFQKLGFCMVSIISCLHLHSLS